MKFYALKILVVCVILFFLEAAFPIIIPLFGLVPKLILAEPWTLVTAMFLHWDFQHLFQNMFALLLFGLILEKIIGSGRFLAIFLISGFIANIAGVFAYPTAISLGASGAIMGIIGTLAILRPKLIVWFGGPMPLIFLAGIWILIDIAGFFTPSSTIGHAVHLVGFAIGILYGFKLRKRFSEEKMVKLKIDREFLSDEEIYNWEEKHMKKKL